MFDTKEEKVAPIENLASFTQTKYRLIVDERQINLTYKDKVQSSYLFNHTKQHFFHYERNEKLSPLQCHETNMSYMS